MEPAPTSSGTLPLGPTMADPVARIHAADARLGDAALRYFWAEPADRAARREVLKAALKAHEHALGRKRLL